MARRDCGYSMLVFEISMIALVSLYTSASKSIILANAFEWSALSIVGFGWWVA
jgi:hypothetical protein